VQLAERHDLAPAEKHDVASADKHDVKDFRVIGELTTSSKSTMWRKKFLQLATYMRGIFAAQPTRRLVHGFLLFDTQMQLWVFDRSGAYSSDTFDILKQPDRFIRASTGYALMTEEELDLDTFTKRDREGLSVAVTDASTGETISLKLEASPFVVHLAIVCRGTCCYRTEDQKHVVKFSWRSDKRRLEAGWRDGITVAKLRKSDYQRSYKIPLS